MAAAAAVQRETIRLVVVAVALLGMLRLHRRAAGDEGRQGIDAALLRALDARLRLVLVPLLVRLLLARLMLLIGLLVLALLRERLRIARNIGLRLVRAEWRLAGEGLRGLVLAVLEAVVATLLPERVVAGFRARLILRIVLAELLLRRRDQAEIMLGVLEIILG